LLRVRDLIGRRTGATLAEIVESESVSTPTALRLVQALEDIGFALFTERDGKANRWFVLEPPR